MSGVARGIGKVFKAVGRVARKIAIPAMIVAAVVATGGAALGAAPALGGGMGGLGALFGGGGAAAAAGGAALTGGSAAAVAGATSSILAGAGGGGGFLAGLGSLLSNPAVGTIIQGAASGWGQGAQMKEQEEQQVRQEERQQASYEGAGAAMDLSSMTPTSAAAPATQGLSGGAGSTSLAGNPRRDRLSGGGVIQPQGLGVQPVAPQAPPAVIQNAPVPRAPGASPVRPGLSPTAMAGAPMRRYQYNPATMRIELT